MRSRPELAARLRRVRFGRCEELLLLGIIVLAALYPVVLEGAGNVLPVLCGWHGPSADAATRLALAGKIACAAAVVGILPFAARYCAGSWAALTRSSAYGAALGVAAVATATLTAYDACTGFHATRPMAAGCMCWLTAVIAGCSALLAALVILAGRAVLALLHDVLVVVLETFCAARPAAAPSFARFRVWRCAATGTLLARRFHGRAPPPAPVLFA
jgi:hypothetical protein